MAKNKQKKKKKRERRVAQEKHVAAAKRLAQKKTTKETQQTVPERTKRTEAAAPKTDYIPTNKKSPFTQRRGGG